MTAENNYKLDHSFVKINKHFSNTYQYDFWKNGYVFVPLGKEIADKYLLNNLANLYNNKESNFFTKDKYVDSNQFDFNSNIEKLDFIIDFLKSTKIMDSLKFITCSDLVLTSIRIRINQNIKKSNSFWGRHRDTSFLTNQSVTGNVPPLKHLIYYPNLNNFKKDENQLKIWEGSHRKIFSGHLDNFLSFLRKKIIIKTSNETMTLFEGSLIHAIGYTDNPNGNLRLIFDFLDRQQIFDGIEHQKNIERWDKMIYGL